MVLFGFHRPLKPCHPGARFKQALEAMSSLREAVRWLGIYGFKGRHKWGFYCFVPPPIDSLLPTCLCRNDMGG